jgi:hypothetical protein
LADALSDRDAKPATTPETPPGSAATDDSAGTSPGANKGDDTNPSAPDTKVKDTPQATHKTEQATVTEAGPDVSPELNRALSEQDPSPAPDASNRQDAPDQPESRQPHVTEARQSPDVPDPLTTPDVPERPSSDVPERQDVAQRQNTPEGPEPPLSPDVPDRPETPVVQQTLPTSDRSETRPNSDRPEPPLTSDWPEALTRETGNDPPPSHPADTPALPQTKDIVFVGGDPLMQSELIDHLGSHGFGENDSIQFDRDRLHQSRDMDPTDMAERMKAGELAVIDLGASPTGDTVDNIAANSDREALGVPQLNADGTQVPGSASYSHHGPSPSYLPLYETMDNTDSAAVTGQTMDRVRQYANESGAGTFEPPESHDPHAQYAMNMAWMGDLMVNNPREPTDPAKSAVADLGADPNSDAGPSHFVANEDRIARNLGVRRNEIPPEVNGA